MEDLDWCEQPLFEVGKKEAVAAASSEKVQGSDAWLKWRNKGVGSSDAAVLLGLSPWKTVHELWLEKRGLWKQEFGWAQKNAMNRGTKLEPCVRALYEAWSGSEFPADAAEHADHNFMRVSYDGVNRKLGRLLEIKCPNLKTHELALQGVVVDHYMAQVQWQLCISGLAEAEYVSYNGPDAWLEQASRKPTVEDRKLEMIRLGEMKHMARVRVKRDEDMIKELIHRAVRFWQSVESGVELIGWEPWRRPESPIELGQVAEQETEQLVIEALQAKEELDRADAKYEALKIRLKSALGDREELTVGDGQMRWITRKGAVDYGKIEVLKDMDLDQYRKPDTKAFEFKRKKAE